jgi:hypothetical protein
MVVKKVIFQYILIKCDRLPISNTLYNIAIMLLFNTIYREAKELLSYSAFIITRHYKRVEIWQ